MTVGFKNHLDVVSHVSNYSTWEAGQEDQELKGYIMPIRILMHYIMGLRNILCSLLPHPNNPPLTLYIYDCLAFLFFRIVCLETPLLLDLTGMTRLIYCV